jgi:hypothetical protein
MKNLLADVTIAPSGGFKGFGPLGNVTSESSSILTFSKFISTAIGVMTIVAFIWFTFVLITGAIGIIGSGGDKQALESSRKRITSGLIGLVIVIASVFILDLIGTIFGIPFLNLSQLFFNITTTSVPNPSGMPNYY